MSWLLIILLASSAFALAAFTLRLPKGSYALFGIALMLGLAGYAAQGSPELASASKDAVAVQAQDGAQMVEARREMYSDGGPPAAAITLSDGFARRGQALDAAGILRSAVQQEPSNAEAWLALANALVAHAEGRITPAALVAFSRSEAASPGHPAPGFFYGIALLRGGQPLEAREAWQVTLDSAPEGAEWKPELALRIARLDAMLELTAETAPATGPNVPE